MSVDVLLQYGKRFKKQSISEKHIADWHLTLCLLSPKPLVYLGSLADWFYVHDTQTTHDQIDDFGRLGLWTETRLALMIK